MADLPIPFPLQGISDTFSYEGQPPGTTVDARNVRAFDGATGRARGAQREGMDKLSSSRLSANGKVQAISTVTYDGRVTIYDEATSASAGDLNKWAKAQGSTSIVATDALGDVWAVQGNALLVKYNSSGVKQFEFQLPVPTANHIVRTIALDDFGNVYVACSEGTSGQSLAWVRSYYPADDTLALRWSITVGGYVEKLVLRDDKLYCAINFPDTGRARVAAYELIFTATPELAQSWAVPYPVNDGTFNEDGEFLTAHGPVSGTRSYDPRSVGTTHIVDPEAMRWNPTMLPNWDDRKWCWFDAATIPLQPGSQTIQDGDEITEWRDVSGRDQVTLRPSTSTSYFAPKWIAKGLAQRPAVRFEGASYRLQSDPSIGPFSSLDETQKTMLPGTRGCAMFFVVKPSSDYTTPSALFYQDNEYDPNDDEWDQEFHGNTSYGSIDACLAYPRWDRMVTINGKPGVSVTEVGVTATSASNTIFFSGDAARNLYKGDRVVITNSSDTGALANGTYYVREKQGTNGEDFTIESTPGGGEVNIGGANPTCDVQWFNYGRVSADAGYVGAQGIIKDNVYPTGDDSKVVESYGKFDNDTGAAIITLLVDNDDCTAPYDVSQFRVNGVPLAQWNSEKFQTRAGYRSVLGIVLSTDTSEIHNLLMSGAMAGLGCDISEILVLRRYTDSAGVKQVVTFPNYNTNAEGGAPAYDTASDTEIERIEGYLAWKYGLSHLLDEGAGTGPTWGADGGQSEYAHPFGLSTETGCVQQPPNERGKDADDNDRKLWTSDEPLTAKWNFQRGVRWVTEDGGAGYAVACEGDNVWTIGPKDALGKTVKLWADGGATITETAGAIVYDTATTAPAEYAYETPRPALDQYGNFWVPSAWENEQGHTSVRVYKAPASGTTLDSKLTYAASSDGTKETRAVALDPTERDYTNNPTTVELPEAFVMAETEGADATSDTLTYVDPITASTDPDAVSRNVVWVAAAGGDIKTFTGGTVAATTGGTGALAADARFVSAVTAFEKVYFTDGTTYKVYDPKTNAVGAWESSTSGAIPERYRLLAFWRGRMVLARGPDDPFNWHMSAVGDPTDWNQFPADGPLETQAISGNNSEIGGNHDIINAVIPYDRERLIFGGDHTIHILWGDPMAGGVISLLSDVTGISFGSGWCKDSEGILYFFGSRGGVYAMAPGGQAERISNHPRKISSQSIDRRLEEVNFDTHYIGMAWDDINQRLLIYQMPYGEETASLFHWCWEKKSGSWWVDTFSDVNLQPTAVFLMDGDEPDDRVIAVGCQDGYVRYPSRTATSDDGYPIDSYVTLGPIYTGSEAMRVRNPKITLSKDQGGCWLEMMASDTPDEVPDAQHEVPLLPGQNPRKMIGVRGAYCWLRLRSGAVGHRWAYESGKVEVIPGGRRVAP